MKRLLLVFTGLWIFTSSCTNKKCTELEKKDLIRKEIQQVLDSNMKANFAKNITVFSQMFGDSFILESNESADSGRIINKEALQKDVLRDWGIITKMIEVKRWIDSVELKGDTAIVYTDQKYKRMMKTPDEKGEDEVLTTQRHKESWIQRNGRWIVVRIKELGGEIFVNGKIYTPNPR